MKRAALLALTLCVCLTALLPLGGCGKTDMSFTAVLPRNVITLDPQTASRNSEEMVIGSLFEGLCRIDADGEAIPGVAERWEHNADYTVFTFHLRDARWSDGSPVTAADFVFGVLRVLRPETGSTAVDDLFILKNARAIYAGSAPEESLGFRAEGDRTLVAELERGNPDFPALTAAMRYLPCKQEYFEASAGHYGLSAGYLLTNGPFTFPHEYAWNTDYNERSLSLVRSEEYRGSRKVFAGSLTYLIDYDDSIDTDPVTALTSGKVDVLRLPLETAKEAEGRGCGVLALDDAVTGLLLNPDCDALDYAGMRELFFKTLDREDLLSRRPDGAEALGVMAPCVLWDGEDYYADGQPRYVPQDDSVTQGIPSLKSLLKLDKIPSITVLCPNDPVSIEIANGFLVAWNAKLGNAYNILPLPVDELESRVAQGEYEAALYTLRSGGASPYHVLKAFHSSAYPLLLKDREFDALLNDFSFDLASYRKAEALLQDKYVFYPLFRDRTYYGLAPGVAGVAVSPDGHIDFATGLKR